MPADDWRCGIPSCWIRGAHHHLADPTGESVGLASIIEGTTEAIFDMAGGFDFTDEIALALNTKWRNQQHEAVVVSAIDLSWLLDGYARARLALFGSSEEPA